MLARDTHSCRSFIPVGVWQIRTKEVISLAYSVKCQCHLILKTSNQALKSLHDANLALVERNLKADEKASVVKSAPDANDRFEMGRGLDSSNALEFCKTLSLMIVPHTISGT